MIAVIGQNSTWQKTCFLERLDRGQVNRIRSLTWSAAGKGGNVTRVLAFLGEEPLAMGYAGGEAGRQYLDYLRGEGLSLEYQEIREETRVCTTLIEEDGTVTELIDPPPRITPREREGFRRLAEGAIARAALLVIGGTSVEGESDDCYRRFTESAHAVGVPVLLDSFRLHGRLALEAAPEILKINLHEFEQLTGRALADPAARRGAYREIRERHRLSWIVVTLGAAGVEGWDGERLVRAVPPAVKVRNSIGSGDAVTAGVVAGWLHRRAFAEAVAEAAALGTANCLHPVPGVILPEDLAAVRAGMRTGLS